MKNRKQNQQSQQRFQIHMSDSCASSTADYVAMGLASDPKKALEQYIQDCPEDADKVFLVTPLAGDVFL